MAAPPIKLHLLPDALDAEGQPRAGLLVPPSPGSASRRTVMVLFPTIAAAVAAKRDMEGSLHG